MAPFIFFIHPQMIKNEELTSLSEYISWNKDATGWFLGKMGQEHYQLLANLVKQLPSNSVVGDIGTYRGASALSLTANPKIKVVTYEIFDVIPNTEKTIKNHPQIEMKMTNCLNPSELALISTMPLVFLDVDPHDGVQERVILSAMQQSGFKGILLLDDIHINDKMKSFWNEIPASLKKVDLTAYGHKFGTGAIIFSPQDYDLVLIG
jgi:hypothetical protein